MTVEVKVIAFKSALVGRIVGCSYLVKKKKKNGPSGNAQVCFINHFINLRDWVRVIVTFY